MTSENIREKTRAVFLAALMVLSVVAMTAAFSGAAAAVNASGVSASTDAPGQSSTHTISATTTSAEESTDVLGLVIEYSGDVNVSGLSASDVDVTWPGPVASFNPTTVQTPNDQQVNIEFSGPRTSTAGDSISVELDGVVNPSDGGSDVTISTHDSSFSVGDDDNSASLIDSDSTTALTPNSVTFNNQDSLGDSVLVNSATTNSSGEYLAIWNVTDSGQPDTVLSATQIGTDTTVNDVVANLSPEITETQTLVAAIHPASGGSADTSTIYASDTATVSHVTADGQTGSPGEVNTFWQGQILVFDSTPTTDFVAGDDYQIREVQDRSSGQFTVGSLAREVRAVSPNELIVRTPLLDPGTYVVEDDDTSFSSNEIVGKELTNTDFYAFEIDVQELQVNGVDSTVVEGDDINIGEIISNRASYDLDYDIVHENGTSVQSGTFSNLGDFETGLTIPANVAPGDYTLEFDVTDTTASAESDLTVNALPDTEVQFTDEFYEQNRGDIAEITMTAQGVDSYWVKIGDLEEVGYEAAVEIAPDNDNDSTVTINLNTFVAGADSRLGVNVGPADAISIDGGSIVDGNVTRANEEAVPRVLDPEVYALEAYDTVENPSNLSDDALAGNDYDVAALNVQESSVSTLTAWTSPFNTGAMDGLSVSDQVAIEEDSGNRADWAVHEIEIEGVYGALSFMEANAGNGLIDPEAADNDTELFEEALERSVIAYDYRQLNPEANRGPKRIGNYQGHGEAGTAGDGMPAFRTTVDDGALTSSIDAANKTIFVTLDNGEATTFQGTETVDVEVGDNYQISSNWGQSLLNAFSEEDIDGFSTEDQVNASQEIVDRTAQFDGVRLDNGDLFIYTNPVEDATISGMTSVAENTEMRLRLTSPDADTPLLETKTVTVMNGTFSTTFDFSEEAPGTNITVTLPGQGFDNPNNAETDGQIIDPEDPFFEVSDLSPTSATVQQGDTVSVSATVTNTGGQEATRTVELTVGGSAVDSVDVTLAPGESEDVSFSAATDGLDGEYTHAVTTGDDTAEGSLTVNAPDPATFIVDALNPQEATATVGDEVQVSATVANEGDVEGSATVELTLDGEAVASQDVTLAGGDFQTVTFTVDTSELSAGDYEHGVSVGDESVTGTLTLEAAATPTPEPTPTPTDTPEPEPTETDTPEDSDGDGAGFGVAAALVALLGAALLAARRRA
jgi:surface glycoprotein (TIGR04207 family)/PGF-CTERM protein